MTSCSVYFPDYNFLVVPTAGCWSRPDFLEIVNRCIVTKAIVALDGSEPIRSLGGLSGLVLSASNGDESSLQMLGETLTKLISCIVANQGVAPSDTPLCAYVINTSTQQILSHSASSVFDFAYKTSIMTDIQQDQIPTTRYELSLANPSSFFEFVQKDILDPTGYLYAYRYVIYINEYYRLVIHVRLSVNTQYIPVCKISSNPDACQDCDENALSDTNDDDISGCVDLWQPLK